MKRVSVSRSEIELVLQPFQRRLLLVEVLSRSGARLFNLNGEVISCSVEINQDNPVRRTASITVRCDKDIIDNIITMDMNNYIRIQAGIENAKTLDTCWWNQGIFIINQNSLSIDQTNMTFSMSLSDKMLDFTGERKGQLHAYSSIVKNAQRFDEVMKNLVRDFGGCKDYDITPIHPSKTESTVFEAATDDDYLIPYDMDFPAGVTVYQILEELVNTYPGWEIFFDADGVFVCQAKLRDGDSGFVIMDDKTIDKLKISESSQIFDVTKIKNHIEVWGKEGSYYGEAIDDKTGSPFSVAAVGTIRGVFSGGNYDHIYDRYKDIEKGIEQENKITDLQKQIGELDLSTEEGKSKKKTLSADLQKAKQERDMNIKITGNDMAKQWAEQLLYENTKLQYTSSLTMIGCPFLNEVGFKISYRDGATKTIKTYLVTGISHDYVAFTTTLTCVEFVGGTSSAMFTKLSSPEILSYSANGLALSVMVSPVENADRYVLYIDGLPASVSISPTLVFTFDASQQGKHEFKVYAEADEYYGSGESKSVEIIIKESGEI